MGSTSEEVGDGSCMSLGTGTKVATASTGGVWYELSVGGDKGGVGEEASSRWSISSA